ncbi:kinetochore protein NUF2 homolog [Telopea speciosissima]|uniref:kinetochore protein NUF2 homolog n=1 Tax=Telopea speciosissima TaxID=54955 RepID=UPI001CC36472|nr:kinetochore protein NUF2 homolog [Telopea speciosissima]XP_043720422.1 kinetochore protein NUF2 homolog [Telopea speciosissima]
MASTFSFPLLSSRDMIAVLSECQIATIREEDLVNPTSELICAIYTNLLIYLDPLQDDHDQADFVALGQLENPDLHVESVKTMNLYHKVKEIVAAVNCPIGFTLKDMVKPDTQRTGIILSAIVNFCLHREAKLNLLQSIVDEMNFHEQQSLELETRISQMNAEISEHREARESEQPFVQQLDAEVNELRQTIQGLNNRQMSLKGSFRTLREKSKEMDEKISNAEFLLVQSAQENAKLRSKIVQSPDKLQGALEEKKSIRAEVKNSERSAMELFQGKTAAIEVYSKAGKKMSKHFRQMQGIQEQVNKSKSIDKDVKILKTKLTEDEVLDMSLEAKLVERQGKAEQVEESKKALEKERYLKHEEVTKELKNITLEVETKKSDLQARQRKVEEVVAEAEDIALKITSVKETAAGRQQELFHNCQEAVNEFHNYTSEMETVRRSISQPS